MLFGGRQPSEQRQNLGVDQSEVGEGFGGLPDLLLARQEDEDVALSFPGEFLDSFADTGDLVDDLVLRIDRGRSRGALRELLVLILVIGADLFRGVQGPVRPETSMTGASSKWAANLAVSMVAEVMMTLRSRRRGSSCLR